MLPAPEWEKEVGIFWYLTDSEGSGGKIKTVPEDFIVEEEGPLGRARVLLLRGEKAPQSPQGSGDYLWFVLEKRDWDTMDVIYKLAKVLNIPPREIRFAGTKDKVALTAQWVCIRGVRWSTLRDVNIQDIAIHTPVYMPKRLRMGELYGNWFTVRIRGAHSIHPSERFINYFGHQRFGSYRFVSHIVGARLLEGDYEGAVWAYLTQTSDFEPPESREARERLRKEGDFAEALKYFPKRLRMERRLLRFLASGKTAKSAILSLHPRTISLFIHAYQSYLFNIIVSRRLGISVKKEDGDICVDDVPTAMVPGYNVRPAEGVQGEVEKEVLEEAGVSLEAFRRWKKFGAIGYRRKIFETVRELCVSGNVLSFYLPKNTYATAFLREIIKPISPFGFIIPERAPRGA